MKPRREKRPRSARDVAYPGRVRIIAGQWRGRYLDVTDMPGLRPTPNRVRETLFNWLTPFLPGADCLDLFAGSGALCIESLSRGAAHAVMVEQQRPVADNLRRNLERLGAAHAEVIEADAAGYLAGPVRPMDIIFVDPPFARGDLIAACLATIARRGWLKPGGLVYVEAPATLDPLPLPPCWQTHRHKVTGQVGYHLLRAGTG
jgi:16S rRNA (guanine966-N2)-methyltransferase